MAVINWDLLSREWDVISQAPATFLIALTLSTVIVGGIIRWFFEKEFRGKLNGREGEISLLKQQLEAEKNEFLRQLARRDEEIVELKNKIETIPEAPKSNSSLRVDGLDQYKNRLNQYSNAELAREARQAAKRLRSLVDPILLKQRVALLNPSESRVNHAQEVHLHNTWSSEGPRMLEIKREIIKRLPNDRADLIDRYPDPYYQNSTMDAEIISQAMTEVADFGSELKKIA
ncbi:hypothetical protein NDA01_03385 [Trichocoleus desertorum AS-A10]|uniref:hypothetical protein n=1 Tax=Trichocoleus desertorum TaxID=1481672 RepID=UPI00329680CE